MNNLVENIILPSLVTIEDLAYIEEASGTLGMLKLIEKLIRYEVDVHATMTLGNQIEVASAVLELYRYRFGSFEHEFVWNNGLKDTELEKYALLKALMPQIMSVLDKPGGYSQMEIRIILAPDLQTIQVELR